MAKQLKESYSSSFNITEDIVRASVEFTTAADELHNFISKGFYSRANDYDPKEAANLINKCAKLLSDIKRKLPTNEAVTKDNVFSMFRKTLNWLNWQINDIMPEDISAAVRKFDQMSDSSATFLKIFHSLPEREQELFEEERTERNAKAAFVLTLKKLGAI